ncbi:DUF3999 domain-containing protein [Pseudomonas sp. SA3-5]|uniref:DUF3999 domain-containing protein n=1 Tax=Pseudomonas aestuarii TaxID=3018340 RepID=A0ABT4X8W6_9PSED|nr:DUF3999 domain-containing protein [Pseudomonas aestuarii]MDA7084804.1 DUF3999 domain-containing protein [Pseudomonas aestuarii]
MKGYTGVRGWLLALLVLAAPLVVGQDSARDYAVQLPLSLSGEGPWYRLELPMAVHMAARYADLRDLRVFNGAGEVQAYALTLGSARQHETQQDTAVKWFPLRGPLNAEQSPAVRVQRSSGGTLVEVLADDASHADQQVLRGWLLDASAIEAPLQQLTLDWRAEHEGFQRFSIEASDDLQHWRAWGDGQIARLSFADERIDQREVKLPDQSARYLRLLWSSPRQAPQLLSARLLSARRDRLAAPLSWSAALSPSSAEVGEYRWELPLALPLQRLRVELAEANSLAPVSVTGRREGKVQWQPLARGLLYRLPQDGQEVLHNELELHGAPVQQLRLQVDERGGGLGSAAPTIRVAIRATQLVFLARGKPPYVLAIGKATGAAASLPLSTLIPGYDDKRLAALGVATAAEAPLREAADAGQVAGWDWKRLGLWAVLLAGVGLLVLMAWSLLRAKPAAP